MRAVTRGPWERGIWDQVGPRPLFWDSPLPMPTLLLRPSWRGLAYPSPLLLPGLAVPMRYTGKSATTAWDYRKWRCGAVGRVVGLKGYTEVHARPQQPSPPSSSSRISGKTRPSRVAQETEASKLACSCQSCILRVCLPQSYTREVIDTDTLVVWKRSNAIARSDWLGRPGRLQIAMQAFCMVQCVPSSNVGSVYRQCAACWCCAAHITNHAHLPRAVHAQPNTATDSVCSSTWIVRDGTKVCLNCRLRIHVL